MQYYKVLTYSNESAWTYTVYSNMKIKDLFCIKYTIGKWTFPKIKGSKLFVFDDLCVAKEFAQMRNDILYECEVQNPSKNGPFIENVRSHPTCVINMWKKYKNKKAYKQFIGINDVPPFHTIWCDAVKIIKQIYPVIN